MRSTLARFALASLTTTFALCVAGCQPVAPKVAEAPSPTPHHTEALWEEPRFTAMLQAYNTRIQGERRVLRFEMSEHQATLLVQDPADLKRVLSYVYMDGALSGPSPADVSGILEDFDLDDNLFGWDQVAIERIPELANAALTESKLSGGRLVQVKIIRREPGADNLPQRIDAEIEARRRALERKIRVEQGLPVGDEPAGEGKSVPRPVLPTAIEMNFVLRAPGASGWLATDARGRITSSGIDRDVRGLPAEFTRKNSSQPYWRRAAGLNP